MQVLRELVDQHKRGAPVGIYSLCSAHPLVIEAALAEAQASGHELLIEATCNQVNQFGGYTGMRAADFRDFVATLARRAGVAPEKIVLGGDHLGPSPWQEEPARAALDKSAQLVDQYVRAGFRKIHLDCSMSCADDPKVLAKEEIAGRAARLCQVAERAWSDSGGDAPCYVVGTEVPTPGGALDGLDGLQVTRPDDVAETLDAHRSAFKSGGIAPAWERVLGLVVQPGVEFDHDSVVDFVPAKAAALSGYIERVPGIVYEAHSTDYQTPAALADLVRGHFAILKVGPGATFALREAYWALAEIEDLLIEEAARSHLKDVLLAVMHDDPQHWNRHYRDPAQQALQLQFSLSDRIRYYWQVPRVRAACATLHANLEHVGIPLALLSQYLPLAYQALRDGRLGQPRAGGARTAEHNLAGDLVRESVAVALRPYIAACSAGTTSS